MDMFPAVSLCKLGEGKYRVKAWGAGLPILHKFPVVVTKGEGFFTISDSKGKRLGIVQGDDEKAAMEKFFNTSRWVEE